MISRSGVVISITNCYFCFTLHLVILPIVTYHVSLRHAVLQKAPKKDGKPGVQDDGGGSGDLPPVKEVDVSQSDKDPTTFSGCVVS